LMAVDKRRKRAGIKIGGGGVGVEGLRVLWGVLKERRATSSDAAAFCGEDCFVRSAARCTLRPSYGSTLRCRDRARQLDTTTTSHPAANPKHLDQHWVRLHAEAATLLACEIPHSPLLWPPKSAAGSVLGEEQGSAATSAQGRACAHAPWPGRRTWGHRCRWSAWFRARSRS
jgi:hypothetical protein